ncbi:MAG: efflux RND transporter periplasmic adaptor subunit [Archangium sp.]|nr:efflux RND transporter periplasmic adaptor subunit [Archangium sp.]
MKPYLVLLMWAALAGQSCRSSAQGVEVAEAFPVASPLVGSSFEREYVGQVQALQHLELRARLKGFIESVGVDEGQPVKAGQLLFSISARELQQEVKKAQAAVERAVADLEAAQVEQGNTKMLFEKKVVSEVELKVATSRVASLAAQLQEARAHEGQAAINLSFGQIRAPFDGVVNRIPRKAGSVVAEDELLTTMTNTDEVFVYFRVSEQEYLDYASASEADRPRDVTLKLANGSVYSSPGVIDAVESEFDKETGNLAFRARFPNPGQVLKHGASGKIVIRGDAHEALVIPQRSTFEIQENVYVFTLDANDVAHAKRVVPRMRVKDTFVLDSGLSATDRFIVEGVQKVKEGDRITVRPQPLPATPSL